ncbi:helix-turn-helix domain-containing protein [Streptomyces gamaensis]|uniref:Helix-turn-helix domain-containing protein n=1 Tax=Streptomyces gamaensis TaxID=1763542 RepID=A0ABW0Z5N0_9ACTN
MSAARDGTRRHGGRPPATDGDMPAVALRRRGTGESVTSIARHLDVDRSTLYRTLAAYDETAVTTAGIRRLAHKKVTVQQTPATDKNGVAEH